MLGEYIINQANTLTDSAPDKQNSPTILTQIMLGLIHIAKDPLILNKTHGLTDSLAFAINAVIGRVLELKPGKRSQALEFLQEDSFKR